MAAHPTYHVNVIELKWEIIWTNGLPHLSGLPHLPGVPHLHVNRPKEEWRAKMATNLNFVVVYFLDSNLKIPTISKGIPRLRRQNPWIVYYEEMGWCWYFSNKFEPGFSYWTLKTVNGVIKVTSSQWPLLYVHLSNKDTSLCRFGVRIRGVQL